jgi:ribosomal protein L11
MPRKVAAEEESDDEAVFDWNVTHQQLKKSIALLSKVRSEFDQMVHANPKAKSIMVTVQRDEGPVEHEFNAQELHLLEENQFSRFNLLKVNRVKPRPGATQALTPVFLGNELRAFLTDKDLIKEGAFDIVEYDKDENEKKRWNPYTMKGDPLKLLKERGLAFSATVANLLRAYGNNRELVANATHNKEIRERLMKKKGTKEEDIEEEYNHAYVGFDKEAKKHLGTLVTRMGKYYKATSNRRDKKKSKGKPAAVKQTVKPTDVQKRDGFDPDQFQYNAMIQSIIKIGKLSGPEDKDAAFQAGELKEDQIKEIARIKKEKVENETYKALVAQDEATMTHEKLENRREKQAAAAKAHKDDDEEEVDEDDDE